MQFRAVEKWKREVYELSGTRPVCTRTARSGLESLFFSCLSQRGRWNSRRDALATRPVIAASPCKHCPDLQPRRARRLEPAAAGSPRPGPSAGHRPRLCARRCAAPGTSGRAWMWGRRCPDEGSPTSATTQRVCFGRETGVPTPVGSSSLPRASGGAGVQAPAPRLLQLPCAGPGGEASRDRAQPPHPGATGCA